ncbi:MAG: hypothetical protein K6C95_05325, partial [Lachnospiraceae bacterium]|nr:hypothetical protein [Lachnospiraceae bacterium]
MSQSDLKTERIARAGRVILGVYICILLPVLSFWAPQGYSHLGNSKFLIYRFISVPFAVILLPLVIARICFLLRRSKPEASADSTGNPASGRKDVSENYVINTASGRKSAGRMLVVPAIVYLLFLTVSFVLAFDHNEALWGTVGWRMGFLSRLLFVFFFIAGILFRPTGPDQAASFPRTIFFPVVFVSGAPVLLLGILNRFSIYPLPYMGVDDSFISTMGNINWYGGYLVLVFAVALGEFICGTSALRRVFAAVLLFLSLFSLVTQGSDGTSLAFAAGVIAACTGVCLMDRGEENVSEDLYAPSGILTRFILLIGFLGIALEIYGILWAIYPLTLVSRDINFWFTPARYHAGLILIAV